MRDSCDGWSIQTVAGSFGASGRLLVIAAFTVAVIRALTLTRRRDAARSR